MKIIIRVSRLRKRSLQSRIHQRSRLRAPLFSSEAELRVPLSPMVASIALHAGVFGAVLLGPAVAASDQQSLYAQVIGPHWHQLVWYSFAPDRPRFSTTEEEGQPVGRAEFHFDTHTIVSSLKQGKQLPLKTPPKPARVLPRVEQFEQHAAVPLLEPPQVAGPPESSSPPLATLSSPAMPSAPERTFVPHASDRRDLMSLPMPTLMEAPTANVTGLPSSYLAIAKVDVNQPVPLDGRRPQSSIRAKVFLGPMPDETKPSLDCLPGPRPIGPDLNARDCSTPRTEMANLIAITKAAPTSVETLEAAARATSTQHNQVNSEIRMVPPPDPSLDGRDVYAYAVQMPNVTSYSGSWLMWFAEREPMGPSRELQPPVPLHKVDPQYSQSAISDGVEGLVVLAGVLQTNGRIRGIRILKGIDTRLDLSAVRALFKWQFIAAQRNGVPIEMDMVAVIPFLLSTQVRR